MVSSKPGPAERGYTQRPNLRSVHGWSDASNHKAWVGAAEVGMYQDGFGYACHSYAAGQNLSAKIANLHSVEQRPMRGRYSLQYICSDYDAPLAARAAVRAAELPERVGATPQAITRDFAVFRNRPDAAMPAEVARSMAPGGFFGRNPALAREIDTPYGTGWIVPGHEHLCIIGRDPVQGFGTACTPAAAVREHGNVLTMRVELGRGVGMAIALAADGDAVFLRDGSGRRQRVPTTDGVVSRLLADGEQLEVSAP